MVTGDWMDPRPIPPWRWRFGLWGPIWIRDVAAIRDFVAKQKLIPLTAVGAPAPAKTTRTKAAEIPIELRVPPFPGGMRMPHLHFEGQIYPMTDKQWQAFSGLVLRRLQERLAGAKSISFSHLMEISEAIDAL